MKHLSAPIALALALLPLAGEGALEVEVNPENVVASRLEGRWVLDGELTGHLRSRETPDAARDLQFVSDPSVLERIPEAMVEFLSEEPIYLAGQLFEGDGAQPFVLTTLNGNPHVIVFRAAGGDPFADVESFNLELVPALLPEADLLFVGGDFNDQPFDAFRRARTSDEG